MKREAFPEKNPKILQKQKKTAQNPLKGLTMIFYRRRKENLPHGLHIVFSPYFPILSFFLKSKFVRFLIVFAA